MKRLAIGLIIFIALVAAFDAWMQPAKAQIVGFCDQSVVVSVASGMVQTLASAVGGSTVYVCAYDLSADTIATTGQFKSGSTNLTGAMRFCDECVHTFGNGASVLFQTPSGGNLTLTTATGAITGVVTFGQK